MTVSKAMGVLGLMNVRALENPVSGIWFGSVYGIIGHKQKSQPILEMDLICSFSYRKLKSKIFLKNLHRNTSGKVLKVDKLERGFWQ